MALDRSFRTKIQRWYANIESAGVVLRRSRGASRATTPKRPRVGGCHADGGCQTHPHAAGISAATFRSRESRQTTTRHSYRIPAALHFRQKSTLPHIPIALPTTEEHCAPFASWLAPTTWTVPQHPAGSRATGARLHTTTKMATQATCKERRRCAC